LSAHELPLLLHHTRWRAVLDLLAAVELLAAFLLVRTLSLLAEVEQRDGFLQQVRLDLLVEWAVRREGGQAVDLKQPWLHLLIQKNVEAQHLEAHRVLQVVGLDGLKRVDKVWSSADDGLNGYVLNLSPDVRSSLPRHRLLNLLEDRVDTPLVASVCVFFVLILFKVVRLLINCIIGEMHKKVVHITLKWLLVWFGGKSCEAFFEYKNPKRINSIEKDIYSHVKLEAVHQEGFMHILLNHILLALVHTYLLVITSKINTSTLTISNRFYNKSLVAFEGELVLKVC